LSGERQASRQAMEDQILAGNKAIMADFEKWLRAAKLKPKTIEGHVGNVSFFINECLLSDEIPRTPSEGVRWVDYFLGYWFIRKAAWASPASIRSNVASMKKFYTFMFETGRILEKDLGLVLDQIKLGLPEWIKIVKVYNDPDADMEDDW
jgi:hypothetical protein